MKTENISDTVNAAQDLIEQGMAGAAITLLQALGDRANADAMACLANAYIALGQPMEARKTAQRAVDLDASNPAAHFTLGRALQLAGKVSAAAAAFSKANDLRPREPEILLRLAEAEFLAGRVTLAERRLREVLAIAPNHGAAIDRLVQVLATSNRQAEIDDVLRTLASVRPDDPAPVYKRALMYSRFGQSEDAMTTLAEARQRFGDLPAFDFVASDLLAAAGDTEGALRAARRAHEGAPGHWPNAGPLARRLLEAGAGGEALRLCEQALIDHPYDQYWLAMKAAALMELQDPTIDAFADFSAATRTFMLSPPEGYPSVPDFNAALARRLLEMHEGLGQPLAQSIRAGSQTREPLHGLDELIFEAFFDAIKDPIETYIAAMPVDAAHPFFGRRSTAWRVSGSWSVRLSNGGRHVSHVHPGGWISSAYYVDVVDPPSASPKHSGWLEIGRPPFVSPNLPAAFMTIPPRPGMLVLFPSYFWHATTPFIGEGCRLSIAFDIVPTQP